MAVNRRKFLRNAGQAALGLVASSCTYHFRAKGGEATGRQKPNIIFIIGDDLGRCDLGCYGSKQVATPNIDRLAAEGIRFTDAYSGCTVCAPARSCLMTGYHMGHTTVRSNPGGVPIRAEDVTVAEALKRAGYACGGFGKWGLGDVRTTGVPEKHGFDVFFGYYHQVHAHDYYPTYLWRSGEKVVLAGNQDGKRGQYSHYVIFEEMKKFLRENKDRAFFCYAPWTPPHGNYEIPQDDPAWRMYKDKSWPENAKVVAAMTSMVDRNVGDVMALLRELKIDDNTIVFFCSDNGAANRFEGVLDSCGPLRGFKRSLYDGGIRVPMIVRWPGKIKPGSWSDLQWYFADVMPTLADLARAESPKGIDGISVVPTLLGEDRKQQKHEYLYWEDGPEKRLQQAVRMGNWKAVRPKPGAPLELYDLSKDIGEKDNVAGQHPDIVAKIEAVLKTCRTEPGPQIEPDKPEGQKYR
jgi:arylsulfatase A-like enzyme